MNRLKVFWYLFSFFIFTIPLSQYLSVRVLAVILIFSFFIKPGDTNFVRVFKHSWDIIIYLSVLIIGLLYSLDLRVGFKVIETSFSFLALPIVLNKVSHFDKRKFHYLFLCFVLGLILACSICLGYSIFKFTQHHDTSVFLFENFTQVISYQPTYMAYYLSYSITVGLYFLYYEKIRIPLLIGLLVFLFTILMLTAGRTAYISMLFVFSFFILKFLFEEERIFSKKMAFAFSVFSLMSMLVINHFNFNITSDSLSEGGDYWERLSLWKSAIYANPNMIFGVGTGDYKVVMNEYYNANGLTQFSKDSFNAHNQFLQSFFSNGLIGMLSVLLLICRPLYLSVRYQNILGILVFFSFIIYSMTEVFLARYQGVVFFSFLHQIFIHFYYSRHPVFSLKKI